MTESTARRKTRLSVRKRKASRCNDWIQAQLKTLSVHAEMAKEFGYAEAVWCAERPLAATVARRSTTNICETPYCAWRWADVTICSSAQTVAVVRQRRSSIACWVRAQTNYGSLEVRLRDVLWKISDWSSNWRNELLPRTSETVK